MSAVLLLPSAYELELRSPAAGRVPSRFFPRGPSIGNVDDGALA